MAEYRPTVQDPAAWFRSPTLWTFEDIVSQILDTTDVDRSGRAQRLAKQAVYTAYRDIPYRHNWSYYFARENIQTTAEYATGTISYDHTGGTNEREITLVGGTFPTDAKYGNIIVANQHYEVEQRISGTVLTLSGARNPQADIAAGTSYTWYRDHYQLPIDFARIGDVQDVDQVRVLDMVTAQEYVTKSRFWRSPSVPHSCSILDAPETFGGLALFFGPAPSTSRYYEYLYQRNPRSLLVEQYSTGTITVNAAATTVTGVGTAFTPDHVGCILRASSDSVSLPTSLVGGLTGTDNPYFAQRVITAVASATSLTIDAAMDASSALTGVKFTISDPIDIEHGAMLTAFLRLSEAELAKLARMENANQLMEVAEKAIEQAISSDQRGIEGP